MKIATYNIWDDEAGMPYRFRQIIEEIIKTDADIICLQEVRDEKQHRELAENECRFFGKKILNPG